MSYREHAPPSWLGRWIECTWERKAVAGSPVRVVPDGCMDVVWTQGRGATVVGANTSAFLVSLRAGLDVVGVRFHPGVAPGLFGIDGQELKDGNAPIAAVWGDDGRRLEAALHESADRAGLLLEAVVAWIARSGPPDPLVRAAVDRLNDTQPAEIPALAHQLSVSERQLRRRVTTAVGYGPKRLARVLRLRRALAAAYAGDELGRVAADAGYVDQAHFTHDCRALAGLPPGALLAA